MQVGDAPEHGPATHKSKRPCRSLAVGSVELRALSGKMKGERRVVMSQN